MSASDLLALLVSWGPCKDCPADFDGNGSVGASGLLTLATVLALVSVPAAWGQPQAELVLHFVEIG